MVPAIQVEQVVKRYGQLHALAGVSLEIERGEFFGLLGPNGAGKTTLMRAVVGLIPPNLGTVRVAGRDPRADRSVHTLMAMVPEDEAVPDQLTARQFVEYVAALHGITDRRVAAGVLERVDLTAVADRRLGGFSKGMRRVSGSAVHYLADVKQVTPDIICNYMTLLTENSPLVFFLDEFDRSSPIRN